MFKFVVCTSILIALACAHYDFKDSDFNELLLDDMELHPQRSKRNADNDQTVPSDCHNKGDKEWNYHCCSGEKPNAQQLEAIKEVKRKCISEVRHTSENGDVVKHDPLNCDGMPSRRQHVVCVGECIGKKFNFLAENGDLVRDALLEHSRKIIGDNKWKGEVLEEYVDKCLSEVKPLKEDNTTCNPYPLEFHHCIWRQFVQGCPAELQIDSKRCRQIRERLASDADPVDRSFNRRFHAHA